MLCVFTIQVMSSSGNFDYLQINEQVDCKELFLRKMTAASARKPADTSRYKVFFDTSNLNKLSKKDNSGVTTSLEPLVIGAIDAMVGPTDARATHTSIQAAITAGKFRIRVLETFTEPSALSFVALASGTDIFIHIDKGITWTTANTITYTGGGGSLTFSGGGTFRYTVTGLGVIDLDAGKRVTFDTCNITNAATASSSRLATVLIEVVIMNSLITLSDTTNCLINTSAYCALLNCTFTGGGAANASAILCTGETYINGLSMPATLTTNYTASTFISVTNTTSNVSNINCSAVMQMSFNGCKISNISTASNASAILYLTSCLAVNIKTGISACVINGSRVTALTCGNFLANTNASMFVNCVFSQSSGFTVNTDGCKLIGCVFSDASSFTSDTTTTFTECTINGTLTLSAVRCIVNGCTCTAITMNAKGCVLSNNTLSGLLTTSANTNSEDSIITSNNLVGGVSIGAGPTAGHQPLLVGNKIGTGGTASIPANCHTASTGNSIQ